MVNEFLKVVKTAEKIYFSSELSIKESVDEAIKGCGCNEEMHNMWE